MFAMLLYYLLIPFIAYVLLLVVQAILSIKQRDWRLGLILPSVFLLISFLRLVIGIILDNIMLDNSIYENIITVAARLFIYNILTISMIGVYGFCRIGSRAWLKTLIIALIIGIYPIQMLMKDGGTTVYFSILYRIEFMHKIDMTKTSGFDTRTKVYPFPYNFISEAD